MPLLHRAGTWRAVYVSAHAEALSHQGPYSPQRHAAVNGENISIPLFKTSCMFPDEDSDEEVLN